jgi:hypothetical protein
MATPAPPATSEMSLRRRQRYHRRLDKMRGYSSMDYDVGASALEEEWQHCKTKEAMAWEERGATYTPCALPLRPLPCGSNP